MSEITTADLRTLLRARYSAPEYALLEEVPDATGGRATRSADAIAMNLWPSRGLELLGFELKVSRSDWLRELKAPDKAEAVCRYCERWFLVAGPGVVKNFEEVPATWGILVAEGRRLVMKRDATKLEPQPVSRAFLAALLRRAHEMAVAPSAEALAAAEKLGREKGKADALSQARAREEGDGLELQQLRQAIAEFERASGVKFNPWLAGNIGHAVAQLMALARHGRAAIDLEHAAEKWRAAAERADAAAAEIRAVQNSLANAVQERNGR